MFLTFFFLFIVSFIYILLIRNEVYFVSIQWDNQGARKRRKTKQNKLYTCIYRRMLPCLHHYHGTYKNGNLQLLSPNLGYSSVVRELDYTLASVLFKSYWDQVFLSLSFLFLLFRFYYIFLIDIGMRLIL